MRKYWYPTSRRAHRYADDIQTLVDGFAIACGQIPNLTQAALVTDSKQCVKLLYRHNLDNHRVVNESDIETVDREWGIYYAAPGSRSPWLQSSPASVREALRKWTLRARSPCLLIEDLTVPRLTFNTRTWWPEDEMLAVLCGISAMTGQDVNDLEIMCTDVWTMIQLPLLKEQWLEKRRMAGKEAEEAKVVMTACL